MPTLTMFWDQLLQLIEEGKVVPVVGQDLLTIPESTGHTLLYPYLAERLAKYLRVRADDLPAGRRAQRGRLPVSDEQGKPSSMSTLR